MDKPAYPVWTGPAELEPGDPAEAYVWDGDEDQGEWVLETPYLNTVGAEVLDPTPMEPPIGYRDQPDMWETVQRMVRTELLARELGKNEYGSFEEEDDFEVGDDYEPTSAYENETDASISELLHAGREVIAEEEKKKKETVRQDPQPKAEDKSAKSEDESGSN